MIGFDEIIHKISKQGNNISKLGRWLWITLKGENTV